MISGSIIEEIKLLFTKQEYEVALKVANEKTKITERPAGLSNLLGLCKILKINRDKKDILSSMLDFEDAYLKEKKTIHGLDSLCNMISISTANVNLIKELSKNILKAQTYYIEAIENFNKKYSDNFQILDFFKFKVGEGIEVKKIDFSEEVKSLAK